MQSDNRDVVYLWDMREVARWIAYFLLRRTRILSLSYSSNIERQGQYAS
jgi:hypothetical protein